MCGIAGIVGGGLDPDLGRLLVGRMCAALAHRGPDGGGTSVHADAAIGMTRLAIVDVEHGHQPMLTEDESIALVFNGEIYNAPALRAELSRAGVSFRTRSDTEVILRLYERDPNDVERHLRGMWAFCVHDRRRRKVVLSRDRFGIKPLYVADTGRALAFASELGALRALSSRDDFARLFELDRGAAHAMLAWSYIPGEETIYRGIKRLAPASRLELDLGRGTRRTSVHWTLRPSEEAARVRSLEEACALVEPALRAAVKEHLESDVPIAAFMSGGIDSSLVAAHAVDASSRPIHGFCIGFREPRFDESSFARMTAQRIGVDITVSYLDERSTRAGLADALVAYDEPFGDSSSLATFLLSSVVGRRHKVALAGDGGDEVFAGYKKHQIVRARDATGAVPWARELLAGALERLPSRTDRTSGWAELLRTTRRVARGMAGDDGQAYLALTQIASLAKTRPLAREGADPHRFEGPILSRFEGIGGGQLRRTLASDLANVLPNDMLVKVDRASMACHLEARVPLLDHRLVEIGVGLPSAFTLGTSGKAVLRALHARRFGPELARRRKQGFGVPVESWLRGPLAPACERLFARASIERFGVLSHEELSDGGWRRWVRNDPQILWNAFALAAWCESVLGDGPEALRLTLAT